MLFQGSGVALVTPFNSQGIDYKAFAQLIDFQLSGGTDAFIICGTTGEPSTMTQTERLDAVRFALEQVEGRVPVIAGCGGNNTQEVVEGAKEMQALGADGLLVVTPYYNKTTQAGLLAHYRAIADAVDKPIITYNVPSRTGLNLLPETMAELAEHPHIVGIKEASGDLIQIMELFRLCKDRFAIYSGNDDHVFPMLALGGQGVISVAANIIPRQMHDLCSLFWEGDLAGSRSLQQKYNPLIKQLFTEVNPIPVKAALAAMGMIEDRLRLPLVPLSQGKRPGLNAAMAQAGLMHV